VKIGLIAAIPGELKPLLHRIGATAHTQVAAGRTLTVHTGVLLLGDAQTAQLYTCAAGMGAPQAAAAVGAVLQAAGSLDAWISCGWAGALTCGVKPPDVYVASEVIDSKTGERWPTATPQTGPAPIRTLTLDHVATSGEKRKLAERYGAVLVDMEGATVARLAAAQQLPFYCIKAISDAYTDELPDFNPFITPQGTMRMPALIAHALLRPRYWAPLARMGQHSAQASRLLAEHLPACLERTGLIS
jgi:adenosylhomocysteine nucleosidase